MVPLPVSWPTGSRLTAGWTVAQIVFGTALFLLASFTIGRRAVPVL